MDALEAITRMMAGEEHPEPTIEDLARSLGATVEEVRDLREAMTAETVELIELQHAFQMGRAFHAICC